MNTVHEIRHRDGETRALHLRIDDPHGKRFSWRLPDGTTGLNGMATADLPLFTLATGDFREAAEGVSCHQAIAADGAFSLGMLADFSDSLRTTGAWWYRALFWEAWPLMPRAPTGRAIASGRHRPAPLRIPRAQRRRLLRRTSPALL